jgi:hypothetical protein
VLYDSRGDAIVRRKQYGYLRDDGPVFVPAVTPPEIEHELCDAIGYGYIPWPEDDEEEDEEEENDSPGIS